MLAKLVPHTITLMGVSALASSAAAQGATMTPTETQRAYNDRGVQHMFDGEFEQAAANFKSSLALGESNIAWLNYGRALFKLRRCGEALGAYGEVPTAPAVAAPSPDEIALVLDRFSAEWGAACTGRIVLECPDADTRVRVDDGEPFACHGEPIPVMPGRHQVAVDEWDEVFAVAVKEGPVLVSLVRSLDGPTDEAEPAEPTAQEGRAIYARRAGPRRVIGATLGAAGIAALGTAFALDRAWVAPALRDYEAAATPERWAETREILRDRQRANRLVLIGGIGATAVGATLFFWPRRDGAVSFNVGSMGLASVSAEVKW